MENDILTLAYETQRTETRYTLIFRIPYTVTITETKFITFDGVSAFNSDESSTLTSYPTSNGTPVSDNIYNNPNTYQVSIKVSGSEDVSDDWGTGRERAKNAHTTLSNFKNSGTVFTVYTPTKTFDNMVITDIANSSTQTDTYDFNGTIKFTELLRVGASKEEIFVEFTPSVSEEVTEETQSSSSSANNGEESDSNIIQEIGDFFKGALTLAGNALSSFFGNIF